MAEELRQFFKEKRLHPLVAWTRYFDVNNARKVTMLEFQDGMDLLNYEYDAEDVFRKLDRAGVGSISLSDIDYFSSDLWNSFKAWSAQLFTCEAEMVAQLAFMTDLGHLRNILPEAEKEQALDIPTYDHLGRDINPMDILKPGPLRRREGVTGTLVVHQGFTKEQFMQNSVRLGWYNSSEVVLFKALDVNNVGSVVATDIGWLTNERLTQVRKNDTKLKGTKGNLALMRARVQAMRAVQSFLSFLRRQYGCIFAAWRLSWDMAGEMSVTRKVFFAGCRAMQWRGDLSALWRALDADDNGFTTLGDIAPNEARVMAQLKRWMTRVFGDAKTMMRCLNTVNGSHTKLSKSGRLTKDLWLEACQKKHCPLNFDYAFDLLDFERKGSIMLRNLKFLEEWQVNTEWLLEQPCQEAVKELKDLLLYRYRQPVKAWVKLLDRSHSGKVTWSDFKVALEYINFKGNVAAAWLALDDDNSGWLTLKEFDEKAAEALALFRCWCDAEFGGVVLALIALDSDRSGTLSYKEFRKGLKEHNFRGSDIQHLFHSLDVEGKGQLSADDLFFLDEWELAEILDARDHQDYSDSENLSHSEDKDAEDSSEDERKEGQLISDDARETQKKMPRQSQRSLRAWPRIPSVPLASLSGGHSRLLKGSGGTSDFLNPKVQGTIRQVRTLHLDVLRTLRRGKTNSVAVNATVRGDDSVESTEVERPTPSLVSSCGPAVLQVIGWHEQRCVSPGLHSIGIARTSESPYCTSAVKRQETPRCNSALGSSRSGARQVLSAR